MALSRVFTGFCIVLTVCCLLGEGLTGHWSSFYPAGLLEGLFQMVNMIALFIFLLHLLGKRFIPDRWGGGVQIGYLFILTLFSVSQGHLTQGVLLFLVVTLLALYYSVVHMYSLLAFLLIVVGAELYFSFQNSTLSSGLFYCYILSFFTLILYMVYKKYHKEKKEQREILEKEIAGLSNELLIKEKKIERLQRPLYENNKELSQAEKELLDCIRLRKAIQTKELASYMCRAESTIGNSIYTIRKKLGFSNRAELFAYVMMCIPDEIL
jgi:DNA-binding CsgD family transcriptional regulator